MKFEQTQETNSDLATLLRSPEAEQRIRKEIKTWPVYTLEARDGDKSIFIQGDKHSYDLASAQRMKTEFKQRHPDVVLVEHTYPWQDIFKDQDPATLDEETFVKQYGEQGYAALLAKKAGIPVGTWDVSDEDRLVSALQKFSLSDIVAWGTGSGIKHLLERGLKPNQDQMKRIFGSVITEKVKSALREIGYGVDFDQIDYEKIWKEKTGTSFEETSLELADRMSSPAGEQMANRVIRYMNELRDRQAIEAIVRMKKQFSNIFVTAGGSHVLTWEPAVRALYPEQAAGKK